MGKEDLRSFVEGISDPPSSGDPDNSGNGNGNGYGDRDDRKDDILESLKEFCEQLDFRLNVFTNKNPPAVLIFGQQVNLTSEMIGQQVHTFLGRHGVEPVVTALDYEYIAEPRRSRLEIRQNREQVSSDFHPDFRLVPRKWSGSVPPDIIGEIKKPGAIESATSDLREYLHKTTPPAYGVATDGLTWRVRKRNSDGVARFSDRNEVPLKKLLQNIRQGIVQDRAKYDQEQLRRSKKLENLVTIFENLP
jgi:hypothetical protein